MLLAVVILSSLLACSHGQSVVAVGAASASTASDAVTGVQPAVAWPVLGARVLRTGAASPVTASLTPQAVLVVNPGAAQVRACGKCVCTKALPHKQAPLTSLPQTSVNVFGAINIAADALKARFCTPAKFTPPRAQSHVVVGPGLSIQITTGSTIINETELFINKAPAFNKTLPAVNVVATPAEFLSKMSGRATVSTSFCRLQRNFGTQTTNVLAVFDGNTTATGRGLDRQAVITTIITEVSRLSQPDVVEQQIIIFFLRANRLLLPFTSLMPANTSATPAPSPAPSPTRSPAIPFTQFSTFERLAPSLAL